MKTVSPYLALFASVSTLLCCALPAAFVALGMGATLVSLISTVPQLIWFSEHKGVVFISAGLLLVAAALGQWQARGQACPVDVGSARACANTRLLSRWVLVVSFIAYAVGTFFAFVAPMLFSD